MSRCRVAEDASSRTHPIPRHEMHRVPVIVLAFCCSSALAFVPGAAPCHPLPKSGALRQSATNGATSLKLSKQPGRSAIDANSEAAEESPVFWPLVRQAEAIRTGSLRSRELVDRYIERIESMDSKINAVVTKNFEAARQAADEADAAVSRGEEVGQLHGVPMTVKDALCTAGVRSTGGAETFQEHIPDKDAPAISELRKEGAIVLGKTNLPWFSSDYQTYNNLFGTTNNPWDTSRTPGGSSGGSAAAVASAFSSFDVGTDMGGSIRAPAAWCGVFGHKPSFGLVDNTGYLDEPQGGVRSVDMNVVGPIARSAADLELLFRIMMRRPDFEVRLPEPPVDTKKLRIGAWLDDPFCAVEEELVSKMKEAADALRDEGFEVEDGVKPDIEPLEAADNARFLCRWALQNLAPSSELTHRDWLDLDRSRMLTKQKWSKFFEEYDVLLMPVTMIPAFEHDQEKAFLDRSVTCNGKERGMVDVPRWNMLISMAGLPSTAVPVGFTRSGLPIGMQVVAKYGGDLTTLKLAAHIETLTGGYSPPPAP